MEVKIGVLRNQLSRYLKRVRQTGHPVIVLDRDVPVGEIWPYREGSLKPAAGIWEGRQQFEKQSGPLIEDFDLPKRTTSEAKTKNPLD